MTLMNNLAEVPANGNVADLSNCGRCVDLVGTGKAESVDLHKIQTQDCVSAFFYRTVDLNLGAIGLFKDADFAGPRTAIFLSEWQVGDVYSISKWGLQDGITSVRWRTLQDRQTAVLMDNADGTGNQYNNIKGWGSTKQVPNLGDHRFNDQASSFRWDRVNPAKEIIAPFSIEMTSQPDTTLSSVERGTNETTVEQSVALSLKNTTAQTVTTSTTDTNVTGIKAAYTLQEGSDAIGAKATWTTELSYTCTHTENDTRSETKTIELDISQQVNAPPMSVWVATMLESVGVSITGGLASDTTVKIHADPIPKVV